jgi:hypothetical protein
MSFRASTDFVSIPYAPVVLPVPFAGYCSSDGNGTRIKDIGINGDRGRLEEKISHCILPFFLPYSLEPTAYSLFVSYVMTPLP